jgi:hypothetical protein
MRKGWAALTWASGVMLSAPALADDIQRQAGLEIHDLRPIGAWRER